MTVFQRSRQYQKIVTLEKRIAMTIIDAALRHNLTVSIFDGDENCVKKSRNRTELRNALRSTDQDELTIRDLDGKKVMWVLLVYGNDGWDVVADHSISTEWEAKLLADAQTIVDKNS